MPFYLLCLLLSLSFYSCSQQPSELGDLQEASLAALFRADSSKPKARPYRVLQAEGIASVPVYSYEGFAPILQEPEAGNDTLYIFNFWATWCGPCVAELPYFERIAHEYKDQKLRLFFVSLDFPKELEKRLIPFLQKRQLNSPVLVLDQRKVNQWMGKIDSSWDGSIPATMIIQGKNRQFYERVFKHDELKNLVDDFLHTKTD